ncbi:hypothetical protein L9F63_016104, partial [Diploptera punctata]
KENLLTGNFSLLLLCIAKRMQAATLIFTPCFLIYGAFQRRWIAYVVVSVTGLNITILIIRKVLKGVNLINTVTIY